MKKYLFSLVTAFLMADALAVLDLKIDEDALATPVHASFERLQQVEVTFNMMAEAEGTAPLEGADGEQTALKFVTPRVTSRQIATWQWAPANKGVQAVIAAGVPEDFGPTFSSVFSNTALGNEAPSFGSMHTTVTGDDKKIGTDTWQIMPQGDQTRRGTFICFMKGGLMVMRHKAFGAFSALNPEAVETLRVALDDDATVGLNKTRVGDALNLICTVMGGKQSENGQFNLIDDSVSRKAHSFIMPDRKKIQSGPKKRRGNYQPALRNTLRDAMTAMNITVIDGTIVQNDYAALAK